MNRPFYARNGFKILVAIVFLMPLMLAGTRQALRSNKNDVKSWLPSAYEETTTFRWYRERFESDMFVLVSWDGCTLDDPRLPFLARKLVPPEEEATYSSRPEPSFPPPFFKRAITGTDLVDQLVTTQHLSREEAVERLKGFVVGRDGKQTCLVLTVNQDAEAIWEEHMAQEPTLLSQWWLRLSGRSEELAPFKERKWLHAVVDKVYDVAEHDLELPRSKIRMGGPPVDNAAIDREGERTLLRLAGVSAAVGLFMAWWCLRSVALTLMVFTTGLFSAGLSLMVVTYSGTPMNAILLTMPSLVYVAAVSGAIHLANYYRDTVRQHGFDAAPDKTVRAAWLPLALATGTTAIGLASMCITELVPIRQFGLFSALGVVVSFAVLVTYMPALLEMCPLKRIAQPSSRRFDPGLSPKWRSVGEFIIRHNGLVTVGCLLLMAVGTWGVTKVHTSVKLMRLFSPDAEIIRDYAWLEEHLGPLVPMEVVVKVDQEKSHLDLLSQMQLVAEVQQAMRGLPDVGSVQAAPTFVRSLPRRASMIERRAWIVQLDKHRQDLREYLYTEDGVELWRVSARVAALTGTDYGAFVKDIRAAVDPVIDRWQARGIEGIEPVYTGLVPLIYKAQNSMLDGLILNFVGDLVLIGVAMIFLTRDWSAGLLLAFPSLFPMALVFGAMGMLGIVVDVGTVMVPAVALGVTVDDAIHFMLWCRHGQERGMDRRQSIMFAYEDCARAIYQSWGVIGLGLSAFALSSFTPTQRFGYLMFIMLTFSSIGNLVLMPALLAGPAGRFFWKKGEKLAQAHRKRHEEETALTEELPVEMPEESEALAVAGCIAPDADAGAAAETSTVVKVHARHGKRRRRSANR